MSNKSQNMISKIKNERVKDKVKLIVNLIIIVSITVGIFILNRIMSYEMKLGSLIILVSILWINVVLFLTNIFLTNMLSPTKLKDFLKYKNCQSELTMHEVTTLISFVLIGYSLIQKEVNIINNVVFILIFTILIFGLQVLYDIYQYRHLEVISEDEFEKLRLYQLIKFPATKQIIKYFIFSISLLSMIFIYLDYYVYAIIVIQIFLIIIFLLMIIREWKSVSFNSKKNIPKKKLSKLDIKCNSITDELISHSLIYQNKEYLISYYDNIFYTINISDLFPENSSDWKMDIEGFNSPTFFNGEKLNYIDGRDIILLSKYDYSSKYNVEELKINISYKYKDNEKRYKQYYDIIICFNEVYGSIIPTDKFLYEYIAEKECLNKKETYEGHMDVVRLRKQIITSARDMCYYDQNIVTTNHLDKNISDNRKVLAHVKEYGNGKTSFDANTIVNNGKIPVFVSPWEANYDHDIILLIYNELSKSIPKKKLKNIPSAAYAVYALMFIAGINIFNFIEERKIYKEIYFSLQYQKIGNFDYLTVFSIISIFLVFMISVYILRTKSDEMLIFKKDNTKVYKDFYVDNIVDMLQRNTNYFLVIEDIDRLDKKAIVEVFRILSSINSRMPHRHRAYALLTYSEKELRLKLDSKSEQESNLYDELTNKVIYNDKWGGDYIPQESMYMYIVENLKLINRCIQLDNISCEQSNRLFSIQKQIELKYAIENNIGNLNFRELKTIYESCFDLEDIDKLNINKFNKKVDVLIKKIENHVVIEDTSKGSQI